jgi:hypothetical protein
MSTCLLNILLYFNKILTFIPYSQLVLCVYTLYSLHHNKFTCGWLYAAETCCDEASIIYTRRELIASKE